MPAIITVENLSKAYRIGHKEKIPDTLVGAAKSWISDPLRNLRNLRRLDTFSEDQDAEDIVWALRDVSFEIQQGEVVGIIGRNGAGKSTLLKILSNITEPTSGRAIIRGRISSLLEVGTGFHQEMTGRDNIYMNGTVLGMTKREIDRKFDEIVDFSGVERFLDTPIKRYSSGMQVRLAFAVAAHLEPEVLIVDEVLAVGDAEFQKKCIGKMHDVASDGRTVFFVSHNLAAVQALCARGLCLSDGSVIFNGNTDLAIQFYNGFNESVEKNTVFPITGNAVRLTSLQSHDALGNNRTEFDFDENFALNMQLDTANRLLDAHVLITLWRKRDRLRVTSITTRELPIGCIQEGNTELSVFFRRRALFPGEYFWSLQILSSHETFLKCEHLLSLTIRPSIIKPAPTPYVGEHGVVNLAEQVVIKRPSGITDTINVSCK